MVLVVKNLLANAGDIRDTALILGSERFSGGGQWQPTPVFLPEYHGQRSLVGYSRWGHKKLKNNQSGLAYMHTFFSLPQKIDGIHPFSLKGRESLLTL